MSLMMIFTWSDWYSMFKSIVHDTNLSLDGKMQHLQNSEIGRAKSAIEGYGYSGDSYYEALKELESRFGKPLVVKVTLNRLRKTACVQNDNPQEVRNLSDSLSLFCSLPVSSPTPPEPLYRLWDTNVMLVLKIEEEGLGGGLTYFTM